MSMKVLELKERFGILANPYPQKELRQLIGAAENERVAMQIAEQSLTLIRSNKLLPISGKSKIPVIWPQEVSEALQPLLDECQALHLLFSA